MEERKLDVFAHDRSETINTASPETLMTPAPLIDQRLVAGFLLGPIAGAILYAAISAAFTGGGLERFWFFAATSLAYGYATSLIVLLPAFLLLRSYHRDSWLSCVAAGVLAGLLFYLTVHHLPAPADNTRALLLFGIVPFVFIACAIRVVAGRRG
ncbi:hypothetical protein GA830_09890 [Mesorhizobium sp. NBSH29]|uniref:hypothetical protein n=1 Tax=Mesorhizobium sp. NBSH29 TaxID=2654249 RepID=UPI0018966059|nr:hypothetical protein [Mesorhizobium sp. NBSH29]QPC87013.1 hypothetical protein GA830_09890 [Mesorhizobium sp. NBSH29]